METKKVKLNSKSPEYHKNYYETHKERILEKMNRIKHCDVCDKDIKFCRWSKHCQGKKHKNLELDNNTELLNVEHLSDNDDDKTLKQLKEAVQTLQDIINMKLKNL